MFFVFHFYVFETAHNGVLEQKFGLYEIVFIRDLLTLHWLNKVILLKKIYTEFFADILQTL